MSERSLKEKTVVALSWNLIDKVGQLLLSYGSLMVLARLLSKVEFGMIAALSIFVALSNLAIDCGFGGALIKKKNATEEDFSTIFCFNVAISFCFYILIFFSAPWIADFFKTPELTNITRVLFTSVIFNALGLTQMVYYQKQIRMDFITKTNTVALAIAVIVSIIAALLGWGVWALVIQTVALSFFKTLFYWMFGKWHPKIMFKKMVLQEHLGFSLRLIGIGFINTIYQRIYSILIGRYYSMSDLGVYDNANKYQEVASNLVTNTFRNVSMSMLASINDDPQRQKNAFRKVIQTIAYTIFPLMCILGMTAKPLITFLITDKWIEAAPILTILCIGGAFNSFNVIISDTLIANGRAEMCLRLELLKKAVFTLGILMFLNKGMIAYAWVWSIYIVISLLLSLIFIKRILGYQLIEAIKDIIPYLFISLFVTLIISLIHIDASSFLQLITISGGYAILYLLLCHLFKMKIQKELFKTLPFTKKHT